MTTFAVSEFMRTLFILVATPFILLWSAAVIDVIRRQYSGWKIVGWLLLILVVPIIGPMIYFAFRDRTRAEVEQNYLAARELRPRRRRAPTRQPAGRPVMAQ